MYPIPCLNCTRSIRHIALANKPLANFADRPRPCSEASGNNPRSTCAFQQLNYFQMPVMIDAVPSPDSL
jgi:hypothetical protein